MTPARYTEILNLLHTESLHISLSENPTTMGPGYVAATISRILDAKFSVNCFSEETELALSHAEILLNKLNEEMELRSDLILTGIDPQDLVGLDAAGRKAYVRMEVDKAYKDDHPNIRQSLRDQINQVENNILELRTLVKILDRRRDEYIKLDSGIRLQHNTMKTELELYRGGGVPTDNLTPATNGNPEHADTELDDIVS